MTTWRYWEWRQPNLCPFWTAEPTGCPPEKMEPIVTVSSIDRTVPTLDPNDRADRRVGERRLHDLLADTAEIAGWTPPRRERRTAHVFEAIAGARAADAPEQAPCRVCGYAEAGHPTLTDPEREIVTALVNQRQAPAFMRRSIIRKIATSLRIR
jgi:hypothetical protein